jgi:hypothetical protein
VQLGFFSPFLHCYLKGNYNKWLTILAAMRERPRDAPRLRMKWKTRPCFLLQMLSATEHVHELQLF